MIRSIRTLDRPTPRFHGQAVLCLALGAWAIVFLAYMSLVAIHTLIGGAL